MINEKRRDASMAPLAIEVMPLIDEAGAASAGTPVGEEAKVSSTDKRRSLLGKLRGAVDALWSRRSATGTPYVIGLTGGIASGKSTARKLLSDLAADAGAGAGAVETIDCDLLGHEAYLPGTAAYAELIGAFGDGILSGPAGSGAPVDRRALGAIVFAEKAAMGRLNAIVWPAIAALARERIRASRAALVVMEAAVLLEASWDADVDEIWVVSAPHQMVLARLATRNGLSTEAAEARVNSQMAADDRVARCHVPLSSAFGEESMRQQLREALQGARERAARELAHLPPTSAGGVYHRACKLSRVEETLQREWWARLRDRYARAVRPAHGIQQLEAILARLRSLDERGLLQSFALTTLATLFHVAAYEPATAAATAGGEAATIALWRDFVSAGSEAFAPADADTVERLLARLVPTHRFDGPASGDAAHLLDAHLAILGAPAAEYAEHCRELRLSCAELPSAQYVRARLELLQGYASVPALYFTHEATTELATRAQSNLACEIALLERWAGAC